MNKDTISEPWHTHTKITRWLIFNRMVMFHSLFHNDINPISQDCRELWVLKCLDLVFCTVSRWLIPNTTLLIISWQNNELCLSCHSIEGKEKYLGFLLCLFVFESKEHFLYLLCIFFYFLNPIVIPGRDVWVSHYGLRWALIPDYL